MAEVTTKHHIDIELYQTESAEWETDTSEVEECRTLCEELNIEGQKKIFTQDGAIPFPKLSRQEKHIWQAFCPYKSTIAGYDQTVIPLRVLKVYKECLEHKYFKEYEILSECETNPDPALLGITFPEGKSYDKTYYLIARWGEALKDWAEIVRLAREKWVATKRNGLTAKLTEIQNSIDSLENLADRYFAGEWVSI